MGIKGLLQVLKGITQKQNISEWKGKRIAIDGSCWLHKAAYSCAQELVLGIPTTKYLSFISHRIGLLKHHQIQITVVFDGAPLPMKGLTNDERRHNRDHNKQMATDLLRQNRVTEAQDYFQKSVSITSEMVQIVCEYLKQENVQYVVAPYEADAQLAYLMVHNFVDLVISEDSDLLVFGCERVFYKMDKFGFG